MFEINFIYNSISCSKSYGFTLLIYVFQTKDFKDWCDKYYAHLTLLKSTFARTYTHARPHVLVGGAMIAAQVPFQ